MTAIDPIVIPGDCMDVMRLLADATIDAIVTDPPYGLGFMGKEWDALPPGLPWAQECLRVLKPGGYLLAFGGSRTWHRLTVAIEDAGFEIRDAIMWLYGQGFPKGKAQLKPAYEPVVVARKKAPGPWLNIDACRIGNEIRINPPGSTNPRTAMGDGGRADPAPTLAAGRWPTNVVLDESQAEALDEQTGMSVSRSRVGVRAGKEAGTLGVFQGQAEVLMGHDDSGGASRFFPVFKYQPKAPAKERPKVDGVAHPTVKPLELMRWLVRLVTPAGGVVFDPFAGSGTTLHAAWLEGFNSLGAEREPQYIPLIHARLSAVTAPDAAKEIPA